MSRLISKIFPKKTGNFSGLLRNEVQAGTLSRNFSLIMRTMDSVCSELALSP